MPVKAAAEPEVAVSAPAPAPPAKTRQEPDPEPVSEPVEEGVSHPQPVPAEPEASPAPAAEEVHENPQNFDYERDDEPREPSIRERIAARSGQSAPDYSDYFDGNSSFAHEPMFRPRLHITRMWTIAALLFAVISFSLVGAVAWYGLPDWVPFARPLCTPSQPGLVLSFPAGKQDRRTLPNGTAYIGASGTISNVGNIPRTLPMIMVLMRDADSKIVYTPTFAAPKAELNPGESIKITQGLTGIPAAAKYAEFCWKPG